jgi:hypothetical protein
MSKVAELFKLIMLRNSLYVRTAAMDIETVRALRGVCQPCSLATKWHVVAVEEGGGSPSPATPGPTPKLQGLNAAVDVVFTR